MTLRTQITLAIAGVALLGIALVGGGAYRSSAAMLRREVIRAVGLAAHGREQALVALLDEQRQGGEEFLARTALACGPPGGASDCWSRALGQMLSEERARGAVLLTPSGQALAAGEAPPLVRRAPPLPGARFAVLLPREMHAYCVQARRGGSVLRLVFDTALFAPIFVDRYGLGRSGESFLADAEGFFVTAGRYPSDSGHSHPIEARPMRACLANQDGEMLAPDYRGVDVIHGFRHIEQLGGACIMAHLDQAEAFAPVRALGRRTAAIGAGFSVVAVALATALGSVLSRSLRRIEDATRALGRGEFSRRVEPLRGPAEIRALGSAVDSAAGALAEARAMEHRILGVLAHDLRSPLGAIGVSAAILRAGEGLGPEQARAVERISESVRRMARMIDELLDLTRARAGEIFLQRAPVDLGRVCEDVVEEVALLYPGRQVRCEGFPGCRGEWDPDRLKQALSNLVVNALRHGRPDAPVKVNASCRGDFAQVEVRNEGEPIPSGLLGAIFEPFTRGDRGTSGGEAGLGLGLYIAREIVRAHGGQVEVRSSADEGTTFTVRLPIAVARDRPRGRLADEAPTFH